MSDTPEFMYAHEVYCNADRHQAVGCVGCSCRAGREIKRLRAALETIAKHCDFHSDFPHGVEGLQRFAAEALKK